MPVEVVDQRIPFGVAIPLTHGIAALVASPSALHSSNLEFVFYAGDLAFDRSALAQSIVVLDSVSCCRVVAGAGFHLNLRSSQPPHAPLKCLPTGDRNGLFRTTA